MGQEAIWRSRVINWLEYQVSNTNLIFQKVNNSPHLTWHHTRSPDGIEQCNNAPSVVAQSLLKGINSIGNNPLTKTWGQLSTDLLSHMLPVLFHYTQIWTCWDSLSGIASYTDFLCQIWNQPMPLLLMHSCSRLYLSVQLPCTHLQHKLHPQYLRESRFKIMPHPFPSPPKCLPNNSDRWTISPRARNIRGLVEPTAGVRKQPSAAPMAPPGGWKCVF